MARPSLLAGRVESVLEDDAGARTAGKLIAVQRAKAKGRLGGVAGGDGLGLQGLDVRVGDLGIRAALEEDGPGLVVGVCPGALRAPLGDCEGGGEPVLCGGRADRRAGTEPWLPSPALRRPMPGSDPHEGRTSARPRFAAVPYRTRQAGGGAQPHLDAGREVPRSYISLHVR
jgi:hypothetical protein